MVSRTGLPRTRTAGHVPGRSATSSSRTRTHHAVRGTFSGSGYTARRESAENFPVCARTGYLPYDNPVRVRTGKNDQLPAGTARDPHSRDGCCPGGFPCEVILTGNHGIISFSGLTSPGSAQKSRMIYLIE